MKWAKLIISVLVCLLAGAIGSIFTSSSVSTWYITLAKPSFNPPSWVFGPVWTTLYVLMGIALYLIWKTGTLEENSQAINPFMVQLFLNVFWSILFFGLRSPAWALIDIIILWTAIIVTMKRFAEIDKKAMYLLIPYILWVSFAMALNLMIVVLN